MSVCDFPAAGKTTEGTHTAQRRGSWERSKMSLGDGVENYVKEAQGTEVPKILILMQVVS